MQQNDPIPIAIADDHPIVRKGIRDLISEHVGYIVVAETGSGDRVIELVRKHQPRILLLDLNLPGMSGLEVAQQIQQALLPVEVIILTMHKEHEVFEKAMDAGVKGYILKESAEDDLLGCLEAVLDGDCYISPQISKYLLNRKSITDTIVHGHPGLTTLSPTERNVLGLISQQKTSKEIAGLLHISVKTVHNHRTNICGKLDLHGINALLKFAIQNHSSL